MIKADQNMLKLCSYLVVLSISKASNLRLEVESFDLQEWKIGEETEWKSREFYACIKLLRARISSPDQKTGNPDFKAALDRNVFVKLENFVTGLLLEDSSQLGFQIGNAFNFISLTLADFLIEVMSLSNEIDAMFLVDEIKIRKEGDKRDSSLTNSEAFLRVISKLCKASPFLVEIFLHHEGWLRQDFGRGFDGPRTPALFRSLFRSSHDYPQAARERYVRFQSNTFLVPAFVELLEALSFDHGKNAKRTSELFFLSQSASESRVLLHRHYVLEFLDNFILKFTRQQQRRGQVETQKQLRHQEELVVCALRLIKVHASSILTSDETTINHCCYILFGLLGCGLSSWPNAIIYEALTFLVLDDSRSDKLELSNLIWRQLSERRIISQPRTQAGFVQVPYHGNNFGQSPYQSMDQPQSRDLLTELKKFLDAEAKDGSFIVTTAFLHLLLALMHISHEEMDIVSYFDFSFRVSNYVSLLIWKTLISYCLNLLCRPSLSYASGR